MSEKELGEMQEEVTAGTEGSVWVSIPGTLKVV